MLDIHSGVNIQPQWPYVCVCVFVCIYVYTYIYIYIHTYAHMVMLDIHWVVNIQPQQPNAHTQSTHTLSWSMYPADPNSVYMTKPHFAYINACIGTECSFKHYIYTYIHIQGIWIHAVWSHNTQHATVQATATTAATRASSSARASATHTSCTNATERSDGCSTIARQYNRTPTGIRAFVQSSFGGFQTREFSSLDAANVVNVSKRVSNGW